METIKKTLGVVAGVIAFVAFSAIQLFIAGGFTLFAIWVFVKITSMFMGGAK